MSYSTYSDHIPTNQRVASVAAHLSALIAMIFTAGWLPLLGPLVIWLIYKDRSSFVRQQAAEAFNFNIAISAMTILCWILTITVVGIPLAWILGIVAVVAEVWCSLRGAARTLNGRTYRYPFKISILS